MVKDHSTAKGLREEEKAEGPTTEGNRQIHPNGYQVENLEVRRTAVLTDSVLSAQTSLLPYKGGSFAKGEAQQNMLVRDTPAYLRSKMWRSPCHTCINPSQV